MTPKKPKPSYIPISGYDARIVSGRISYFAIGTDGTEYPMPDAFKDMYDDEHLGIRLAHSERPEMFDIDTEEYYIPLRTVSA